MLFFGKYVATEPGRAVGTLVSAWKERTAAVLVKTTPPAVGAGTVIV